LPIEQLYDAVTKPEEVVQTGRVGVVARIEQQVK
jgi:hypothetical protein